MTLLSEIRARLQKASPGPWEENWKPIPLLGCEGYEVSDFGNVRSRLKKGNHKIKHSQEWRLLSLRNNGNGYLSVSLPVNGNRKSKSVHRIVMLSFIGPCPKGYEVSHLNGDKADNRLVNLKYCTHRENESHKVVHGTSPRGENNGVSKLQGWQVSEIRYLAQKSITQKKIAALFDIDHKLVHQSLSRGWEEFPARTDIPALLEIIERKDEALKEISRGKMREDLDNYAIMAARLTGIARRALEIGRAGEGVQ